MMRGLNLNGFIHSYNIDRTLEYHNEALEIRKKYFGENHAVTALSYSKIGSSYLSLNDYENSFKSYMQAFLIYNSLEKQEEIKIVKINIDKIKRRFLRN